MNKGKLENQCEQRLRVSLRVRASVRVRVRVSKRPFRPPRQGKPRKRARQNKTRQDKAKTKPSKSPLWRNTLKKCVEEIRWRNTLKKGKFYLRWMASSRRWRRIGVLPASRVPSRIYIREKTHIWSRPRGWDRLMDPMGIKDIWYNEPIRNLIEMDQSELGLET